MGKRSDFDRIERDFYPTPIKAVVPLIPHLNGLSTFIEPCAGDGRLIEHITKLSTLTCVYASDIEPLSSGIYQETFEQALSKNTVSDSIITNPPWDRKILHPLLDICIDKYDNTWLLFDADWAYTKQAIPYLGYCEKIVTIGRVKWIEDSKATGKDNCCWYLFKNKKSENTIFVGQQ